MTSTIHGTRRIINNPGHRLIYEKNHFYRGPGCREYGLYGPGVEFIEPRNVQHVNRPEITTYTVNDRYYVLYDQYSMSSPISHTLQLDAYDAKTMKPLGTQDIDKTIPAGDANIFAGTYALADQLVMFKYEYEKGKGCILYYYLLAEKGNHAEGVELATIPAEKAMNSGNFEVSVSEDGSKIAVLYELPHVKEALDQQAVVYVFDNTFKELWKKEYSFPYASEKAPRNTIFVNNDGVVFNLKQVPVKKSFDFYSVFTFAGNGEKVTESKLDLGENGQVSSYKSAFAANGDLQLLGYYYADKKSGVNVETPVGTFFVKVSATDGSLPVDKITTFDPQQNIKALYLLPQADNGFILVGERQYENQRRALTLHLNTITSITSWILLRYVLIPMAAKPGIISSVKM